MNQFILTTPNGEPYGTLMDLPLTRAGELTLIMALREGFTVTFEKNGRTPESERAAAHVAAKVKRVAKRSETKKAVAYKSTNPADDKYHVGDSVYLAWSQLPEKQRLQLSSVRTTKGAVAETRQGRRPVGVRFNGDPELVWLERVELARIPEVSG